MSELISLNQVLILSGIHLLIATILYTCAYFLLPKSFHFPLLSLLILIQAWSLTAVLVLYFQENNFLGWFFNPSGEKNSAALLSTTLLMLTACSGLGLSWQSGQIGKYRRMIYWLLLSCLFLFLATDEYFSIHETIVFWRGGYLILGTIVAIISFIVLLRGEPDLRSSMLMLIIGLGIVGVAGVVLDAFSADNLLDIGPIKLTFIRCRDYFIGLNCREFGNTEEMLELSGVAITAVSLLAILRQTGSKKIVILQRRIIFSLSFAWFVCLILWMWVVPEIQARLATPANTNYGDISLLAYDLNTRQIQAGDKLTLTLYTQANQATESDYSMSVHLYSRTNPIESIAQDDMELGEFVYPSRTWLRRLAVRNRFRLDIPEDLDLNQSYQLVAILWQDSVHNRIAIQETIFPVYGDGTSLVIDAISAPDTEIVPSTRSTTFQFSEGITLAEFTIPDESEPGDNLSLSFLWDVDKNQDTGATHFMHWFNIETGDYLIFDRIPRDGLFPTQDWIAGTQVRDNWLIQVPEDIPPGSYRIQTGLFNTLNAERFPVSDSNGQSIQDNSIVLAEIIISDE